MKPVQSLEQCFIKCDSLGGIPRPMIKTTETPKPNCITIAKYTKQFLNMNLLNADFTTISYH